MDTQISVLKIGTFQFGIPTEEIEFVALLSDSNFAEPDKWSSTLEYSGETYACYFMNREFFLVERNPNFGRFVVALKNSDCFYALSVDSLVQYKNGEQERVSSLPEVMTLNTTPITHVTHYNKALLLLTDAESMCWHIDSQLHYYNRNVVPFEEAQVHVA